LEKNYEEEDNYGTLESVCAAQELVLDLSSPKADSISLDEGKKLGLKKLMFLEEEKRKKQEHHAQILGGKRTAARKENLRSGILMVNRKTEREKRRGRGLPD